MTDILDYWVLGDDKPPRANQIAALNWLQENIDKKYFILELPVGGGKSAVAMTFSRFLDEGKGSSFILTPQRILQAQYNNDFSQNHNLATMYGKPNYDCNNKNTTCDIGSLVKPRCTGCTYECAKEKTRAAPNAVFNYKLALLLFGYTEIFDPRNLMILDECHTVEEHLTEFNSIVVHEKRAEKLGIKWRTQTNIKNAVAWIASKYLPKLNKHLDSLSDTIDDIQDKRGSDLTAKDIKTLREYDALETHIDDVAEFLHTPIDAIERDFVLVHDKSTMKFKRLTGEYTFKNIVDPQADKFLFMSSTVLDCDGFCRDLGINKEEVAFISLQSDFPAKHRPIVYLPQMKMNAAWKSDECAGGRKKMVGTINELLNLHENESGIIHTANFQIAQWLVDELEHIAPQQVLHHNPDSGDDRGAIINQYLTTPKPTLLISPSITEGLDLRGDLGRFAIVAKVPFGFLGDQWIKKRLEMSQSWYQRRALIGIIQGGGRIVRSSDDSGNVYILDASWAYLYSQTSHMIPKWWKDSYTVI